MERKTMRHVDEVHIGLLLRDILKNAWLGVVAALVVCIGILVYNQWLYQPEYTAEMVMAVTPRSSNMYESYAITMRTTAETAEMFREVFESDTMERWVRNELQNPDLGFKLRCHVAKQTNIIRIYATADTPGAAYSVMQAVKNGCDEVSEQLFGEAVLEVLLQPQMPTTPSNLPDVRYSLLTGTILAIGLSVCIIALVSVARTTAKPAEGIKPKEGSAPNVQIPDAGVIVIDTGKLLKKTGEVLKKTWVLGMVLMVLGASAGVLIQQQGYVPNYRAYCTFGVRMPATLAEGQTDSAFSAVYDKTLTQQLDKTVTYLLTGGILNDAIRERQGMLPAEDSIAVESIGETNVFELSAYGETPEEAARLLESTLAACEETVGLVMGPVQMVVMEEVITSDTPDNIPNSLKGLGIGGAIGFGISVAISYLRHFLIAALPEHRDMEKSRIRAVWGKIFHWKRKVKKEINTQVSTR